MCSPYFQAEVVNHYGPTECTDVVCFFRLADPLAYLDRDLPLGEAVDNVHLHILDELGRPLPAYAVGELCITGICVGTGYWRNEALTAEAFVENPFGPGLMYRTGDLAYRLPDGVPVYVGRRDFQVKVRGLRIELGEIEAALRDATGMSDWLVLASNDTLVACVRTDGPAPSAVRAARAARRTAAGVHDSAGDRRGARVAARSERQRWTATRSRADAPGRRQPPHRSRRRRRIPNGG